MPPINTIASNSGLNRYQPQEVQPEIRRQLATHVEVDKVQNGYIVSIGSDANYSNSFNRRVALTLDQVKEIIRETMENDEPGDEPRRTA